MKVSNTVINAVLTAVTFWEIKSSKSFSFNKGVARNKVSLALGAAAIVYVLCPFEVLKEENWSISVLYLF